MTREEFEKIFEVVDAKWEGDNALQGLKIMEKYIDSQKTDLIQCADHGIIYSVDIDQLIDSGITEEDAIKLRRLNWIIKDSEYMACFV